MRSKRLSFRQSLKSRKNKSRLTSIGLAFGGLWYVCATQRNMQLHLVVGSLVIGFGAYCHLCSIEWGLLTLTIGQVLSLEVLNTSIETTVDLVTKKTKYRAKISKDSASAAVLLSACQAVGVGYFIFFDRLVVMIKLAL